MTESFNRQAAEVLVEVLAPQDLPLEATTWPPEKVTLYWLSGQAQSWRVRVGDGAWIETDFATIERLQQADDAELETILAELGA